MGGRSGRYHGRMDAYLFDWFNLLLRWAHVIVSIAWIGSSFYFVFLDNSLTRPTDPALKDKGVDGELWAVHGGGFYNPQKYMVAPRSLPERLHWFFWESYSTWLTGFALFTVLYLFNAETFLIDRRVFDWSAPAAIGAALGFLVVFWFVYDLICRALGPRPRGETLVGLAVCTVVVLAAWLASQLFAGRAAFLLIGAMMATAMSANVLVWIIPGQRTVIAQMRAGLPVDPIHGQRGKQRSVHNTYFTLPVLIAMLSNHYGWLYQSRLNWLVLVVLMLAGALIRHSFVARHRLHTQGRPANWWPAVAGVALIVGLMVALAPSRTRAPSAAVAQMSAEQLREAVRGVVEQRCLICHQEGNAQKGVMLHSPDKLQMHAQAIYQQVVVSRLMPQNNATQISEDERALIRRWYESGAGQKP